MRCAVQLISHILRQALALLIAVQLGSSAIMGMASGSELICNPSGQAPTAAEIANIEALYAAAGKTLPEDVVHETHCEKCLTPTLAILPNSKTAGEIISFTREIQFSALSIGFYYNPQGPPLGGRAPPNFV